jgi:hypothetical protein
METESARTVEGMGEAGRGGERKARQGPRLRSTVPNWSFSPEEYSE